MNVSLQYFVITENVRAKQSGKCKNEWGGGGIRALINEWPPPLPNDREKTLLLIGWVCVRVCFRFRLHTLYGIFEEQVYVCVDG